RRGARDRGDQPASDPRSGRGTVPNGPLLSVAGDPPALAPAAAAVGRPARARQRISRECEAAPVARDRDARRRGTPVSVDVPGAGNRPRAPPRARRRRTPFRFRDPARPPAADDPEARGAGTGPVADPVAR